jgi:hypothetical protein
VNSKFGGFEIQTGPIPPVFAEFWKIRPIFVTLVEPRSTTSGQSYWAMGRPAEWLLLNSCKQHSCTVLPELLTIDIESHLIIRKKFPPNSSSTTPKTSCTPWIPT